MPLTERNELKPAAMWSTYLAAHHYCVFIQAAGFQCQRCCQHHIQVWHLQHGMIAAYQLNPHAGTAIVLYNTVIFMAQFSRVGAGLMPICHRV
jgi:hypothetical protein